MCSHHHRVIRELCTLLQKYKLITYYQNIILFFIYYTNVIEFIFQITPIQLYYSHILLSISLRSFLYSIKLIVLCVVNELNRYHHIDRSATSRRLDSSTTAAQDLFVLASGLLASGKEEQGSILEQICCVARLFSIIYFSFRIIGLGFGSSFRCFDMIFYLILDFLEGMRCFLRWRHVLH